MTETRQPFCDSDFALWCKNDWNGKENWFNLLVEKSESNIVPCFYATEHLCKELRLQRSRWIPLFCDARPNKKLFENYLIVVLLTCGPQTRAITHWWWIWYEYHMNLKNNWLSILFRKIALVNINNWTSNLFNQPLNYCTYTWCTFFLRRFQRVRWIERMLLKR